MSEIKVTFGALDVARSDVAGTATRISGRLDDLRRAVTPLAAAWQGHAADEYQSWQRQWDTAAADLTRVLVEIGRALGEAEVAYRATESANAARWGR